MGLRPCEREWSAKKALGVRLLVVELTGKECPCDRGVPCPLFPELTRRRPPRLRPA